MSVVVDTKLGQAVAVHGLTKKFGGVNAIDNVTFDIAAGECRGIIGPNGAGKSTLLKMIGGQLVPNDGRVSLGERDITSLPTHERAQLGLAMVFQGSHLFKDMSVLDNIKVGASAWLRSGVLDAVARSGRLRREERDITLLARAAMADAGLTDVADQRAGDLPFGRQRAVQVARALCGRPSVLLLDEPAAGLHASEREQFVRLLLDLKRKSVTILLIEHDVALVRSLADRLLVLDIGAVIADGPAREVLEKPEVIEAYLGVQE